MRSPIHYLFLVVAIVSCQSRVLGENNHRSLEENVDSKLRYVAFGTSVTFGSGVDPEKDAYIQLLGGTNLAIRASDPSYPSICTQSMIGDAIYDVIIVEYDRRYGMGLNALIKRLRERFVDATIIVTNVWTYMNVNVIDENNDTIPFRNWLIENGFEKNTPEALAFVKDSNVRFEFSPSRVPQRKAYMDELVRDYNVKMFSWSTKSANLKFLILRFMPLYLEDFVHWSKTGHRYAAIAIEKIVKAEKTKVSNRVGPWGEGDKCVSWFGTGTITNDTSTNGEMVQFDNRFGGKYALEFPFGRGYIDIENPFSGPRELTLSYMTTGPAPSIYPKTKIKIGGQKSMVVDPTDTYYSYPVHVQCPLVIGTVNPGMNKVFIIPLEKKLKLFRLIGYSITNESKNISKMWTRAIAM